MTLSAPIVITVKPILPGWAVECEALFELQIFRSGAQAERSAVRLSGALTRAGWCVKIVVLDLHGAVAGLRGGQSSALRLVEWRPAPWGTANLHTQ